MARGELLTQSRDKEICKCDYFHLEREREREGERERERERSICSHDDRICSKTSDFVAEEESQRKADATRFSRALR